MLYIFLGIVGVWMLCGFRVVRPVERGVVETFGKYSRPLFQGLNFVFPMFQKAIRVNITEKMADIEPQEIITEDNLNASVDLVVFYQVKSDPESIKQSLYSVNDFESQIITLARTTARNVIGGMVFKDVNSKRKELNEKLATILQTETEKWGVQVVRVELKDIVPPKDVQETMNQVIKAENTKRSAIDFATAEETKADGVKRALIKEAEGDKQASILKAEGQAEAFNLVNKSFTGNAQVLRNLEVLENSLKENSKIVITDKGISPQIILGELPLKLNAK